MTMSRKAALAQANDFLQRHLLIDGHNDLPWVIRADKIARGNVAAFRLGEPHNDADTDIPKLREGRVAAQVLAAFLPTRIANPATVTLEQIDVIRQIEELHADVFHPVRKASDIATAHRRGKIGAIMSVEGGVGLENSLAPLRMWHALGMRIMTLCHNETLDWIDSATDAAKNDGITDFGRAVVAELNRLGVLIDVSHASPKAAHDVFDASDAPVALTHSNAFALCEHPRNAPDDLLRRIPEKRGIVMATFVPAFIRRRTHQALRPYQDEHGKSRQDLAASDYETAGLLARTGWEADGATLLAEHIEYMTNIVGIDHIGIGSDFYGGPTPPGLDDASKFPNLFAELIARGWAEDALAKLAGKNTLRVLKAVEKVARDKAKAARRDVA
ncbi:membrane dipeptidase [Variibacter gotjawalensis]|uniref:Membrane dipeptidase n=1 Tax=Variibacter gotjawalensis TaxID=1333996 RepID=A0A0S3PYI3_9BRAD|nr:dipeptidase [Variibacter gotjawalensis]NIK46838.1 membrane dipeptidase [Variibacter gotjawalensis]RZS48742.1 membrane dipeptidase [Variibacter gotjawalensis]BAT61001.1 membrane dipeptidase [Variibacter gotjawalensis]